VRGPRHCLRWCHFRRRHQTDGWCRPRDGVSRLRPHHGGVTGRSACPSGRSHRRSSQHSRRPSPQGHRFADLLARVQVQSDRRSAVAPSRCCRPTALAVAARDIGFHGPGFWVCPSGVGFAPVRAVAASDRARRRRPRPRERRAPAEAPPRSPIEGSRHTPDFRWVSGRGPSHSCYRSALDIRWIRRDVGRAERFARAPLGQTFPWDSVSQADSVPRETRGALANCAVRVEHTFPGDSVRRADSVPRETPRTCSGRGCGPSPRPRSDTGLISSDLGRVRSRRCRGARAFRASVASATDGARSGRPGCSGPAAPPAMASLRGGRRSASTLLAAHADSVSRAACSGGLPGCLRSRAPGLTPSHRRRAFAASRADSPKSEPLRPGGAARGRCAGYRLPRSGRFALPLRRRRTRLRRRRTGHGPGCRGLR